MQGRGLLSSQMLWSGLTARYLLSHWASMIIVDSRVQMTGLDPDTDSIIEIYCLITDGQLQLLDENGWGTVVHQTRERMAMMDEWCTRVRTFGPSRPPSVFCRDEGILTSSLFRAVAARYKTGADDGHAQTARLVLPPPSSSPP